MWNAIFVKHNQLWADVDEHFGAAASLRDSMLGRNPMLRNSVWFMCNWAATRWKLQGCFALKPIDLLIRFSSVISGQTGVVESTRKHSKTLTTSFGVPSNHADWPLESVPGANLDVLIPNQQSKHKINPDKRPTILICFTMMTLVLAVRRIEAFVTLILIVVVVE